MTKVCGMVLGTLTSEHGQPTGLSLACSSSAIAEALKQINHPSCGDLEVVKINAISSE